ncbi:hypothetical protein JAAARDRAFT_197399 [Jaapia argillacea MUCL 33604]|uniref:BTB domain-containing protein n=1 Tax=Jaapia argillacea MUCL 33604 TaxID=933084 RepID=A0A067PFA6_9AGAM|nr:hypothetical protein JAAARDRAFT_197399 [Jaapia argillacea MUCL 33604]
MNHARHSESAIEASDIPAPTPRTRSDAPLSPATSEVSDFEDVGEGESLSSHTLDGGGSFSSAAAGQSASVGHLVRRSDAEAPSASPSALLTPKKHELFYIHDNMAVFLVEDTLFKVHSFFFQRDSEYFRTLLSQHSPSSESHPIKLGGVSVVNFVTFLGVLYPIDFTKHTVATVDEWISVLALATKWSFTTLRSLAIRELFPLASPVDKIVVGRQYDIPEWLRDAYVAVCAPPNALTKKEGERLGLDEVIKISQLRQDVRTGAIVLQHHEIQMIVGAIVPPIQKAHSVDLHVSESTGGPKELKTLHSGVAIATQDRHGDATRSPGRELQESVPCVAQKTVTAGRIDPSGPMTPSLLTSNDIWNDPPFSCAQSGTHSSSDSTIHVPGHPTPASQAPPIPSPVSGFDQETEPTPTPITCWAQLLRLPTAPSDEDFDLGGKSLVITGMLSEWERIVSDRAAKRRKLSAEDAREIAGIRDQLDRPISMNKVCRCTRMTPSGIWELAKRLQGLGLHLDIA